MSEVTSGANLRVKQLCFEGVLKGTGALKNETLLQELKPYYNTLIPKKLYSAEDFIRFFEFLSRRLYPQLAPEQAFFEMGRQSFQGFLKGTIVGRVALAAINFMGAVRFMTANGKLWEDAGLGIRKVEQLGPRQYRSLYRDFVVPPEAAAGVVYEGLTMTGAKNIRYKITVLPSPNLYLKNYDIVYEWD